MGILNTNTSPNLKTERLLLRQVTLADANEVFFLRSDKAVGKYIARPPQKTLKEAKDYIIARHKDIESHKISYWAITLRKEDTLVGTICLWNFTKNHTVAEVGYDLNPAYQKQGIMNEELAKVLNFGFEKLELHQVDAYTQRKNKGSIALLQRNKFKKHPTRIDEDFPENIIFELDQFSFNQLSK